MGKPPESSGNNVKFLTIRRREKKIISRSCEKFTENTQILRVVRLDIIINCSKNNKVTIKNLGISIFWNLHNRMNYDKIQIVTKV